MFISFFFAKRDEKWFDFWFYFQMHFVDIRSFSIQNNFTSWFISCESFDLNCILGFLILFIHVGCLWIEWKINWEFHVDLFGWISYDLWPIMVMSFWMFLFLLQSIQIIYELRDGFDLLYNFCKFLALKWNFFYSHFSSLKRALILEGYLIFGRYFWHFFVISVKSFLMKTFSRIF